MFVLQHRMYWAFVPWCLSWNENEQPSRVPRSLQKHSQCPLLHLQCCRIYLQVLSILRTETSWGILAVKLVWKVPFHCFQGDNQNHVSGRQFCEAEKFCPRIFDNRTPIFQGYVDQESRIGNVTVVDSVCECHEICQKTQDCIVYSAYAIIASVDYREFQCEFHKEGAKASIGTKELMFWGYR